MCLGNSWDLRLPAVHRTTMLVVPAGMSETTRGRGMSGDQDVSSCRDSAGFSKQWIITWGFSVWGSGGWTGATMSHSKTDTASESASLTSNYKSVFTFCCVNMYSGWPYVFHQTFRGRLIASHSSYSVARFISYSKYLNEVTWESLQ